MDEDTPTGRVAKAIQSTTDADTSLDGSFLSGFIVIAEWMDPNGEKWLSAISSDASGNPPPAWQVQGYLFNALHDWPDPIGDEDECDES